MIEFEDFKKVDLRIGKIVEATEVEKSNKLLNLKINIGEEERQILSGIAQFYKTEELVGKMVVVVVNLKPRMMMGMESQGMLLAADGEDGPIILIPEKDTAPGAEIT